MRGKVEKAIPKNDNGDKVAQTFDILDQTDGNLYEKPEFIFQCCKPDI